MARQCGKCGGYGHNIRTCGKPKKLEDPNKPKKYRTCSQCGESGHNSRTCGTQRNTSQEDEKTVLDFNNIENLDIAREHKRDLDVERSKKLSGKWLVNPEKKKVAGRVVLIKEDDDVLWYDFASVVVVSGSDAIKRSGYEFFDSIPVGEGWSYNYNLIWTDRID